ncbi:CaiB/BaiF CoA transferase family protein, partial [Chloroflexota bacterium]
SRSLGPPFVGGEAAYYLSFNRSKRGLTINMKNTDGINILKKLLKEADVLVENFRVGVMAEMGLSYQDVSALNPAIIYCSISGYGQDSPLKNKPGFDAMIQGESGFMDITGFPDGLPTRVGVAISDIAGAVYAVQGILLALIARQQTGKGQYIDVALMDSLVSFLTYQAGIYFATGDSPLRSGNRHPVITPYESFVTKDGYVIIAAGSQKLWERLCNEVLARPELIKDPRFLTMADRNTNQPQLKGIIEEQTKAKSSKEWIELLEKNGIPCGRIRKVGEVLEDENLQARSMVVAKKHPTAGEIKLLGNPVKMPQMPIEISSSPPSLGQHTAEILKELGYSDQEIETLKSKGIV